MWDSTFCSLFIECPLLGGFTVMIPTFITDFHDPRDFSLNPSCPNPGRRDKINLNIYFHASLLCLKRFYDGASKGFMNVNFPNKYLQRLMKCSFSCFFTPN